MTYIFCGCEQRSCGVCIGKKRAFRAGQRAYRQGRSRHRPGAYAIDWTDGWLAGREANPNTARARTKERKAAMFEDIVALTDDRKVLDKRIAKLQKEYHKLT